MTAPDTPRAAPRGFPYKHGSLAEVRENIMLAACADDVCPIQAAIDAGFTRERSEEVWAGICERLGLEP